MKKLMLVGSVMAGALCAQATVWNYDSLAGFAAGSPWNHYGLINYTGPSGTIANETTLGVNGSNKLPLCFNIPEGTDITFTGAVQGGSGTGNDNNGSFVKVGGGSLTFAPPAGTYNLKGAGQQVVVNANAPFAWDDDGKMTSGAYYDLYPAQGTLTLKGTGRKSATAFGDSGVIFNTLHTYVGGYSSDSEYRITGGAKVVNSSNFFLGAHESTKSDLHEATLRIDAGGWLSIGYAFNTGCSGRTGVWAYPHLLLDGGQLTVDPSSDGDNTGIFSIGRQANETTFEVTNGGRFVHNSAWGIYQGLNFGVAQSGVWFTPNATTVGHLLVKDAGSEVCAYNSQFNNLTDITVRDGGTVRLDHEQWPGCYNSLDKDSITAKPAVPKWTFDGATLAGLSSGGSCEWLTAATNYLVGAKGLAIDTSATVSRIDGALGGTAVGMADGASIAVSGNGQAAISPTKLPVTVGGTATLRLAVPASKTIGYGELDGVVTAEAGASLMGVGRMALDAMTVPATAPIGFRAHGMEFPLSGWSFVDVAGHPNGKTVDSNKGTRLYSYAAPRADGGITMNRPCASRQFGIAGAAWKRDKVDVTRSFTLEFDFDFQKDVLHTNGSSKNKPIGLGIVWQNVADGLNAYGSFDAPSNPYIAVDTSNPAGQNCGFQGASFTNGCYFGIGIRLNTEWTLFQDNAKEIRIVKGGAGAAQTDKLVSTSADPVRCRVDYDATEKTIRVRTVEKNGGKVADTTCACDLAQEVGADAAYFGFTSEALVCAGCSVTFRNVQLRYADDATDLPALRVGGKTTVAAGQTWKSTVAPDVNHTGGFVFENLTFADGAVLDIGRADCAAKFDYGSPALGFRTVSNAGTGSLVKKGSGNLALDDPAGAIRRVTLQEGGLSLVRSGMDYEGDWFVSQPNREYLGSTGIHIGDFRKKAEGGVQFTVATYRKRVRIDGNWTAKFRVTGRKSGGNSISMFLHNASKGLTAVGNNQGGLGGGANGLDNFFALGAYTCPGQGSTGCVKVFPNGIAGFDGNTDVSWKDCMSMAAGDVTDVVVAYDATAKTLTLVQTDAKTGKTFNHVFENCDPVANTSAASHDNEAWFGFGSYCHPDGGRGIYEFSNISFESSATPAETAATAPAYLDRLDVTGPSAEIVADTHLPGAVLNVATAVSLAPDAALTVKGSGKPAKVLLPAVENGGNNTITVDGTTLRVVSPTAFGEGVSFVIRNGGKLWLDFDGQLVAKTIVVDGVELPKGSVHSAATASWIEGTGRIERYRSGLILVVR